MPCELFDEYHMHIPTNTHTNTNTNNNSDESIHFDVHLKTLLDCLQLFGSVGSVSGSGSGGNSIGGSSQRGTDNSATSGTSGTGSSIGSTIKYDSNTSLLVICLEDMGVVTICELTTLYTDDYENQLFELFSQNDCNIQIIMKSNIFKDVIQGKLYIIYDIIVCTIYTIQILSLTLLLSLSPHTPYIHRNG